MDTCYVGRSLPSRERGLKLIEEAADEVRLSSLPSRERGLKSVVSSASAGSVYVAPFTGAWIEISYHAARKANRASRSLHGSVD